MPTKTITLTKTNSGGETDNYNIYHTSVSAPNLVASGVSRATLEGGVQYTVDVSYYTFIIVSTGTCTNQTTVNITPSDVTAPSIPTGLTASSITQTTFTLNWNDSTETESGLAGYKIFVNGVHTYSITNGDSIAGLTGQPAGATVTYTISAYDNAGNESSQSSGINVTFIPAPPTGLFELSDTTTSITASWSSVTGATGYRLRRGASTVIYTGASTSASDTGMTCGTGSNTYYVEAYNATGSSGYSGGVTMTVSPDVTAPTVPTGLYKVSQTDTTLSVAWNASTDSCSGMGSYYISLDGGAQIYTGTDLSHTLTGLTANTSYGVQVKARDNAGNYSNYSSSVNMSTDNVAVPSVPTGLYEISDTTTSVTMGWNASTGSVTGYRLRRGASTTVYTGAVTSYTDSGLACGTASNTYYVQAYGPGGDSAWSSGVTGNVAADVTAPSIPSNVHHIGTTTSSATITCDVSTDACTGVAGYYLYKDNVQYGSLGTTTRSVTGLSAGTSYLFKMSAQDNAGNISSASSNITVWTQCIAPTLSYSSHTTTSVTVARNSVTGGSSYILEWRVSGGSWAIATSAMGTAYTKTGLTVGTTYEFRCQVQNPDGGIGAYGNTLTQATTSAPLVTPTILEVDVFYNAFSIRVSSAADASVTQIEVSAIGEFEGERGGISSWTADGFGHLWTSPLDLITDQEFIIKARYKNAGGTVGNWSNTIIIYTDPGASTL
jgi:chitodextrinase